MKIHDSNALPSPFKLGLDLLLVTTTWALSFYFRFHTYFTVEKGIPNWVLYLKLTPFVVGIWFLVLYSSGLYTKKFRTAFLEAVAIYRACILATLAFIGMTFFYAEYHYSRVTFLFFSFLHPIFLLGYRSLYRKYARYQARKTPPQRVIIIGEGSMLEEANQFITLLPYPCAVSETLLLSSPHTIQKDQEFCRKKGWPIITLPETLSAYFSVKYQYTLLVALPHLTYARIQEELEQSWNQIPEVIVLPDMQVYQKSQAKLQHLYEIPSFLPHVTPLSGVGIFQKRALDFIGSLCAILLFSPIMIFSALLIKLTSKGPVFYAQERVGLDGCRFRMLKFRSMSLSAEKNTGAVWATKNDARVTPIGKFLRSTSLDELPQLFNVLKGEMSLVGPRPEREVFVTQFRQNIPQYMLRHKVKTGMTGWAQVNGWRGDTDLQKRIEFDLFYVQNWSMQFDLKILFLTVFKGFVHPNAY